jgi:hypothetical protein
MGVLIIKCPVTGKEISTGVETDADGFARMPNLVAYAHCTHCMTDHAWRPLDATLVDMWPPLRSARSPGSAPHE